MPMLSNTRQVLGGGERNKAKGLSRWWEIERLPRASPSWISGIVLEASWRELSIALLILIMSSMALRGSSLLFSSSRHQL
jgi:hypothetical protein